MNKRPGHVEVTTEVGHCSFCNRTRNLRREEHHLGTLVRTIVTCETCHRTLSSSIGVAQPEHAVAEKPAALAAVADKAPAEAIKPKRAPAKKAAKPAAKTAKPAKPTSTATRKVTKKK
jgi:hypothetical protein